MRRIAMALAVMALGTLVMAQSAASSGSGSSGSNTGSNGSSSYLNVASIKTPTFSAATTTPDTITMHWALVDGDWREVLTTSNGMTLYYNDQDTTKTPDGHQDKAKKATCTGACATAFEPYLLPKNVPGPTGQGNLTYSYISTLSGPNGGTMVAFQGHPLYTFVKDQRQGEALGAQVTSSHWHVATPALDQVQ